MQPGAPEPLQTPGDEPDDAGDLAAEAAVDEALGDSADPKVRRLRRLAVQVDSEPTLLTAARRLRRRLPGDEKFGDPMSTAGTRAAEVVARRVSALQPERKSLLQELGLAGLQVWQSVSEAAGRGHGEVELAVLFTDLVGFSSWALRAGDDPALELLRQVGNCVEGAIDRHEGRLVKRLGDGVMATFLSAQAGIDAALDAQGAVAELDIDGYRPRLRAGLHWGSPRRLGGDYLGVDVNIAARVADAAKGGQVLVSDRFLAELDADELHTGRAKRLRADGAPRDLRVVSVARAR
jgi:adenylate cyclase